MNKRKKYIKQKMVILCAFILGILIAIYIKTLNPQKVYITLEEKKNLEHKIEIENKQIEKLRNIKLEYEKDLEAYEQKSLNEKSVKELMEYELSYLKDVTGKTVEELVEEQGDEKSIIDIAKEVENKIKVAARECNVSVEGYVKELKKADGKDIDEKIANANEEIEGQYMGNNPRQH